MTQTLAMKIVTTHVHQYMKTNGLSFNTVGDDEDTALAFLVMAGERPTNQLVKAVKKALAEWWSNEYDHDISCQRNKERESR